MYLNQPPLSRFKRFLNAFVLFLLKFNKKYKTLRKENVSKGIDRLNKTIQFGLFYLIVILLGASGGAALHLKIPTLYVMAGEYNEKTLDPIAIANTYIVYTTLFFVIVAMLVGVFTMYMSIKIDKEKSLRMQFLMNELYEKIRTEDKVSMQFVDILFENKEVLKHIIQKIDEKILENRNKSKDLDEE